MKKILILSVLAIATTIGWAQEFDATEPKNVGGINYVLYEDGLAVTYNRTWKQINDAGGSYYTNYTGDIVIPETVEGYKVVAILNDAFTGRDGCSITSISIPSTVRSIGDHAFYDCYNLETVELPASLESIGDGAFILCAVKSMTIPVSCMKIGGSAFNDSGIETFTIEDSEQPLTIGGSGFTIGSVLSFMPKCKTMYVGRQINYEGDYGTFWGCDNITDVTYGPNVTSIKVHEWWRSPSIQHVTFLTDQVTEIPEGAFSECTALESVQMPAYVQVIADNAFNGCPISSINIPETVTSIGQSAFNGCALTSMTIPATCTSIGGSAFNNSAIETFTLADGAELLHIGGSGSNVGSCLSSMSNCKTMYVGRQIVYDGRVFWGCENITDVTYGPNVTSLGKGEWWRSPSIKHVTFLTDQVPEIPEDAFSECTALESVQMPAYVQVIADNAFNGCPISSINIPETVTSIGKSAFNGCALTSMTIPAACTSIGGSAFNNSAIEAFTLADGAELLHIGGSGSTVGSCLSSMSNCKTMYVGRQIVYDGRVFWGCENITDVTYGPNVTSLGKGEWWRSPSIKHVTFLTDQVPEIPEDAFSECTALESVQMPAYVQVIGDNAFNGCPISSINIPETVTSIGQGAFKGCALTSMTIPAACTSIGGSAFNNSAIEAFTLADGAELLHIGGSGSTVGSCLSSMSNCKTMYVGRQIVYDGRVFWGCDNITDVTYGPNVTSLGKGEWWRSPSIKHVTFLSPQLTVIAEDAFSDCSALETVSLPENLVTIENNAFASCKALKELNLPSTVVTIGQGAFNGCATLTSLVIPASVENIENSAFNSCDAVETLRFEDSDKTINLPTYNYGNIIGGWMHNLKSIYLGRNFFMETNSWVTTLIGQSNSIEEFIVGDKVTELWQEYMCYNCKNLKRVVIGKGVTSIAKSTFSGCTSLESIEVNAEVPPVCGEDVFYNVDTKACQLTVPAGSISAYKAAEGWKDFFDFEPIVDFNEDGDMNVTDVVTLISCIAKNDFTSVSREAADVNGDGEVNVTDVVTLILMIATSK